MNADTRQDDRPALRSCFKSLAVVLAIASLGPTLQAQTFVTNILTTTYLDSRVSNQTNNYGNAHTVKVVIDNDVTSDGSMCRGLFQFPSRLWSYAPSDIVSASVSFYVWEDNTTNRNVTLYPLTTSFVQGTGYGTYTTNSANWLTYDGVDPWNNPGGDFDTNYSVIAVKGPILSDQNDRFFYWDVTPLLQNPTSYTELQNHGAILRIDETPVPTNSIMPRAPFTSAYDPAYTSAYWPALQVYIRPKLLNVTISNAVFSFTMSNLTVGATNTIQRSSDMVNWTNDSSFVATGSLYQWSEPIQPGWTKAFYRVQTQF
jgi:hypothetical protein